MLITQYRTGQHFGLQRFALHCVMFHKCAATKMPRAKETITTKLKKYTSRHPQEFTHDGSVLFCKLCECSVSFDRSCHVDQHRATKVHATRLSDLRQAARQTQLQEISDDSGSEAGSSRRPNKNEREQFSRETCEVDK